MYAQDMEAEDSQTPEDQAGESPEKEEEEEEEEEEVTTETQENVVTSLVRVWMLQVISINYII